MLTARHRFTDGIQHPELINLGKLLCSFRLSSTLLLRYGRCILGLKLMEAAVVVTIGCSIVKTWLILLGNQVVSSVYLNQERANWGGP